jgi:hypothetical protein
MATSLPIHRRALTLAEILGHPMDLDLVLLRGFYLFSTFIASAFFFQCLRGKRRLRLGRHLGFYPSSASMGNALHQLQTIAQPQAEHAVVEILNEEADEDDAGDPEDSAAHFRRQTARIRRGENIDRLVTKYCPKR